MSMPDDVEAVDGGMRAYANLFPEKMAEFARIREARQADNAQAGDNLHRCRTNIRLGGYAELDANGFMDEIAQDPEVEAVARTRRLQRLTSLPRCPSCDMDTLVKVTAEGVVCILCT